ncbi:hypothetical protein F2Q70_00026001 [Brassica cretica]|uniref:Uncharacterized protein n=1 Tax=Brassica cretica TaxID=69181 RepID=A0A8S9LBI4_BRACR|nr:hypothetical protein F2Q70_00026001 [Brassica cretica]
MPSMTEKVIRPRNVEWHFAVKTKIKRPARIPKKKRKSQRLQNLIEKTKGSSNKRSKETEPESPSSPPQAPKKRVDMISWGQKAIHLTESRDMPKEEYASTLRLLSADLHRRVRCVAMYGDLPTVTLSTYFDTRYIFELTFQCHQFEVYQHHVSEVMIVLLKSGQSASQEEAVEEMKDCRSITQNWCRSTVMPERGPSIFQDRLKPRSHTKSMGNPCRLVLDMSRSGLTVPGRLVTAIGERVQSVPLIKSMARIDTERMQWEEDGWPDSTSYGQDSHKGRGAWEGSFMGVGNDPVMVFDHG